MRLLPALLALLITGSGCGLEPVKDGDFDPETPVLPQGTLQLPTTVWDQNPRAELREGEAHGYLLPVRSGAEVTALLRGRECGAPDPVLTLLGPGDGEGGVAITANDDAPEGECPTDSLIHFTAPEAGEYLLVASLATTAGGSYRLDVSCDSGDCALEGASSFQSTRVETAQTPRQGDLSGQRASLDKPGTFLFNHVFRVSDGLGNAMHAAPAGTLETPNMRLVHNGAFGGPDGQSCVSCHSRGGSYSGGDTSDNIYQAGNGLTTESALVRNPRALRGLGHLQAIAAAITEQLEARVQQARDEAAMSGEPVDIELCVGESSADGQPCFGNVVVHPDETVDAKGVRGIDPDRIVRPFGVKGREERLYKFVLGGFRVHFGMQSADVIDDYCKQDLPYSDPESIRFRETWGDPFPDCHDPDADGLSDEITFGQIAAMTVHLVDLPLPAGAVRPGGAASVDPGEEAFGKAGCAACHVKSLAVSGSHVVVYEQSKDPEVSKLTLPLSDPLGDLAVWSDFKRHDMGEAHRDRTDFNNPPGVAIGASMFITPPLWDVARSAPYLHDGRAATLEEAIDEHQDSPEAADSVQRYRELDDAEREALLAFLLSLGAE